MLGIGKTGRGGGGGAGDFLVKPGPGAVHNTTGNCYFCTKDGLLMQKRTHASCSPPLKHETLYKLTKDRDTLIEQSAGHSIKQSVS